MQIKISRKREKMLRAAIFEAFCIVTDDFLNTRDSPDTWSEKTKEICDHMLDLEHAIEEEIFSKVYFSNVDNDGCQ